MRINEFKLESNGTLEIYGYKPGSGHRTEKYYSTDWEGLAKKFLATKGKDPPTFAEVEKWVNALQTDDKDRPIPYSSFWKQP